MSMASKINDIELELIAQMLDDELKAASEAVETLVSSETEITSFKTEVKEIEKISFGLYKPALIISLNYTGCLKGKAILFISTNEVNTILGILMNKDLNSLEALELDEINIATIKEVFNQIYGAISMQLTAFFEEEVTVSLEEVKLFENANEISQVIAKSEIKETVVSSCILNIKDILSGRFMVLYSLDLSELILKKMNEKNARKINREIERDLLKNRNQSKDEPVKTNENRSAETIKYGKPIDIGSLRTKKNFTYVNISESEFPDFSDQPSSFENAEKENHVDLLMDISLKIDVEIGKTRRKMREILSFSPGTIINLEKQAGAPVDIIANGNLVAKGDVMVINDNFAVRISEIINTKSITNKLI